MKIEGMCQRKMKKKFQQLNIVNQHKFYSQDTRFVNRDKDEVIWSEIRGENKIITIHDYHLKKNTEGFQLIWSFN